MAKRKNKLLLSDLFPELAAEREVAEEEEALVKFAAMVKVLNYLMFVRLFV